MNDFDRTNEHNDPMANFAVAHIKADAHCLASTRAHASALALARCLPRVVSRDVTGAPLAWWDRARTALATLTLDESLLAGAGLRGGSVRAMEFVQGDVHLDLEVEPLVRHSTRRGIVRGQVESGEACDGVPVVLIDEEGNEAASTTLDDLGFFSVFLPVGTYGVAIALPTGAMLATGVCVQ